MTNGLSATAKNNSEDTGSRRYAFPKSRRLLKRAEFRRVYEQGFKVACACFVAFCWRGPEADGPKVGFTTPRALGKSTLRNRMRRRLRESVRHYLADLAPEWHIVFNVRRASLTAAPTAIDQDVERMLLKCKG